MSDPNGVDTTAFVQADLKTPCVIGQLHFQGDPGSTWRDGSGKTYICVDETTWYEVADGSVAQAIIHDCPRLNPDNTLMFISCVNAVTIILLIAALLLKRES